MAKVNRNWFQIDENQRWWNRTQIWWEVAHHTYTFNIHDPIQSLFQPGGTSILSINKVAHMETGRGICTSGLG